MRNNGQKKREPLTIRVLRVLLKSRKLMTRADLIRAVQADAATEITRPIRDLRKFHVTWFRTTSTFAARLAVPCKRDAAGRPAYFLTEADRLAAAEILEAYRVRR